MAVRRVTPVTLVFDPKEGGCRMSTNDLILLNQLLDQRLSEIGSGLPKFEYFELFSAEQVVKDDDLSCDWE